MGTPTVHYTDFLRAIKDAGWELSRRGGTSLVFQRGKERAIVPDLNSGRPDINPEQLKEWCARFGITWPPAKPKGDHGRALTDAELEAERVKLEAQHAPAKSAEPMVRHSVPGPNGTRVIQMIPLSEKRARGRKAIATRKARMASGALGVRPDEALVRKAIAYFGPLQREVAERIGTHQSNISRWLLHPDQPMIGHAIIAAYGRMASMVAEHDAEEAEKRRGTAFVNREEMEDEHRLDHAAIEAQVERTEPEPKYQLPVAVSTGLRAAGTEITGQMVIRYIEKLETEVRTLRAQRAEVSPDELATLRRKASKWDQFTALRDDD